MKVKLGFIGTGGMAGAHMRNLQTFDDIEFTAMCDVSEERAQGVSGGIWGQRLHRLPRDVRQGIPRCRLHLYAALCTRRTGTNRM